MKPTQATILKSGAILTPVARATFVHLFEPDDFGGNKKYGLTLLFSKGSDLTPLKRAAHKAAKGKKEYIDKVFKDGNERAGKDGYGEVFENVTFISAKTNFKPQVAKKINGQVIPITDPSEVYWGMYVRAVVTPHFYNITGNKGVSFTLKSVLKIRDGEPLGGGSLDEDYADCEDSELADTGTDNYDDQSSGEDYWGKDSGNPEYNDDDVDNFDDDDDDDNFDDDDDIPF